MTAIVLVPSLLILGCQVEPQPGDSTTPSSTWHAPTWLDDAERFTVGADEGWTWEHDASFVLEGASVPQIFVGPDGLLGMMVTDNDSERFRGRVVLWSDDGLSWSDGGLLFWPDDLPSDCGDRLEDATILRSQAGSWTFLVEGSSEGVQRRLCAVYTDDMKAFDLSPGPVFSGFDADSQVSVPAALQLEGADLLWYNDLNATSAGGAGVRIAGVDQDPLGFEPWLDEPFFDPWHVDPMPVYVEGGGVRLYYTHLGGEAPGIYGVDLDEDLLPIDGEDGTLVIANPKAEDEQEKHQYMDPAFLRLPDGRAVLYVNLGVYTEDSFVSEVQRWVGGNF